MALNEIFFCSLTFRNSYYGYSAAEDNDTEDNPSTTWMMSQSHFGIYAGLAQGAYSRGKFEHFLGALLHEALRLDKEAYKMAVII
ncbi:MAG: hypothetical protein AAGA18_16270 [Verrucomicrobiota bacterium]